MAKRRKIVPLKDDEVLGQVNNWLADALDYNNSILSQQRADALKYYLGEPFGNEQEGKSQVVTRDVAETVDWIMPSLMKVFTSGKTVVQYEPQNEDDVPQAEQETEYVNYLFMRKNPGFTIMHDWFQDALMMKNGTVKVYVEEVYIPEFDYYTGLDEEMVLDILSNPDVELLAQTDNGDGTFDIKVKCTKKKREIKVCAVPPEEFLIDRDAKSLEDAQFVAHRTQVTRSYLRAYGVPDDVLEGLEWDTYDQTNDSPEAMARDTWDGSGDSGYQVGPQAPANQKVWISECYVNMDVDGDGIAELRKIVVSGNYLLSNEETPCKPFADLTSHRIAHKFYGMSIYDRIKDIQMIRSTLMRNILDNIYRLNNGRFQVIEGAANLDDLLSNNTAGVVRVKQQDAIKPLDTPAFGTDIYNMLDRMESERSKRTGVSDTSRGLEADTLHSNQAAMSVNQVMTAAEQQIDLIARMFAETGVKQLFQLLHEFSIRYQDQEEVFQLRGQFVRVNPANWRERYDLTVCVGIGNMNKDQQLMHLIRMWEMAQTVVAGGGLGILVSERNLYNMLKEITQNAGYKDVGKYWNDPDSPEAQQAKQAREEAAQKPTPDDIKAQADMLKAQADAQSKQLEAQAKQMEFQVKMAEIELKKQEATIKLREMSLKEAELELDRERFAWERARDEAEYNLESIQARSVAIGDGEVPSTKKPRKKPSNS